ncbi:MAG: type II secretion system protein [Porticoccaceae bacterium]|nr:type II secretion system protein [Pseudomonadales bacterium]MCP5172638.1 type II secretion system protein [Pseudomonadales bacterium]MCP5302112.1 type II secretion system protein [Pseudomonadales bacterium]
MLKVARQSGFTLIELIAVILILSVLTAGVASQFSNTSQFQAMTTRDDIVAGLFYAQQIALARAATDNTVAFVSSGNSIDVLEDGTTVNGIYPLTLPGGFTLTSATLNYDKLGRTTATALTLSDGSSSVVIQVSASGYAN